MSRPKPVEERDEFKVSPPISVGRKIRAAAAEAGMGAGPWCVAVLTWAVERGVSVSMVPQVTPPPGDIELPKYGDLRLNDDGPGARYGVTRKESDKRA